MNKNNEIENIKNQLQRVIFDVNSWSIKIETTIRNVAFAMDNQIRNMVNLITQSDHQNRIDTSRALSEISTNVDFSLKNNSFDKDKIELEMNTLKKQLDNLQENTYIALIYHNSIFKKLEKILCDKKSGKSNKVTDLDHFIFQENKIKRNKKRKINNEIKEITLPTFIRHFFNHGNDEVHENPTEEEIQESIFIILKILNKENKILKAVNKEE